MAVPQQGTAAETSLYDALNKAAQASANAGGPKETQTYAAAAKDLAEALAWLRVPGESHGGGATSSS